MDSLPGLSVKYLVVRHEDLERDSQWLPSVTSFAASAQPGISQTETLWIPPESRTKQQYSEYLKGPLPPWLSDRHLLFRVSRQLRLFPELEETAVKLGYPPLEKLLSTHSKTLPDLSTRNGTIVLFHTDDPIYREEARRCIQSIEVLGLKYDLTVIPPGSSWVENCAIKPAIIAEARRRIRGPILYLDVDAVVHRDPWPYLAQYDGDMAVYVHQDGELISATILVNDTQGARKLLKTWQEEQKKDPQTWDQRILQGIMEEDEAGARRFNIQRLPPNYLYIFDKRYSYLYGDVVIEQLQASREHEFKKNLKGLKRRRRRISQLAGNFGEKGSRRNS